jgi:hypothetical protein
LHEIPKNLEEFVKKKILPLPNVVGFSKKLQPKIVKGKETETLSIRVYVKKKIPIMILKANEIIPTKVEEIPTDIIEVGEIKALQVDKTKKFRPIICGISVGNKAITAGSIGYFFKDKKGNVFLASNAHVLVDDASHSPDQVKELKILQPGPYDIKNMGGNVDDPQFLIGLYYWHKQVYPIWNESNCPIGKAWARIYNSMARILGSKTRLKPVVEVVNHIDFALAETEEDYELKFPDFDYKGKKFIGLYFAGSDSVSIACKVKYMIDEGYVPLDVETAEVIENDIIQKSGRTTCYGSGRVTDSSAFISAVNYGNFIASFDDCIITEPIISGGDSGTSMWK